MKRILLVLGLMVSFAAIGLGEPAAPWQPRPADTMRPLTSKFYEAEFKGNRRACAICSGDGSSVMALYVYDVYGNCVAWDDFPASNVRDDLAVDWYPPRDGYYVIEAHNCGILTNTCKIFLR
jgi:hypothetical protein